MRLIDAKVVEWKVEQFLQYRYEDYGMMFGPGLEILNIIRNAPTIEPKPNDPLTLDELREMEGKPVPVWCDKANGYIFISTTKTEPYNQVWYFNYKGFLNTVLYYSTKFYRHKPEEEIP